MSINTSDELTFNEDDFTRKPIAEKLIELLLSDIDLSPIVIDGDWGTGKTYFCKKTKSLIEANYKDSVNCTYIDAFAADHINEPLITMIAAISKLIPGKAKKEKFLKAAKGLAKYSIKAVAKAGISFALRTQAENIENEIKDAIKLASNDSIEHVVSSLIQQHENAEENINTLKKALLEVAKTKSVVIFIDELDRCKPDFAVSILEVIKHIFDVPGIKFVLVTNFTQMKASINHCYGQGVNAQRYLDKFIKYSFTLPIDTKDDQKKLILASCKHAEILLRTNKTLAKSPIADGIKFIKELIVQNELSLREVETFVRYLSIYTLMNKQEPSRSFSIYNIFSIFVVFLFCFHLNLKKRIFKQQIKALDLCKLLGVTRHKKINVPTLNPTHSQILAALITIGLNDGSIEKYESNDLDDIKAWKEMFSVNMADSPEYKELFYRFLFDNFKKLTLQI